jgi:hypothetical protein
VTPKGSTKENINKLIEFRQAIYSHAMTARRDAQFDLLDALVTTGSVSSFAKLSQSDHFRRKWPSIYAAMEDGRINSEWLRKYLAQRIQQTGICVFALDGSPWPRPRARTLEDRQFVFQASSDVNGGTVTIGYPYSMLEWIVEAHTSWSLPIDTRRIESTKTAQEVGAEQIKALAEARKGILEALDIVACDGKYGNCGFLRSVKQLRCGIVTRLRRDRTLRRELPPPPAKKKRGRPKVHGSRFAFKEPDTWGPADEMVELEDPRWGKVTLERWNQLHELKGKDIPYDVVRARVHLEREQPPPALWLAWLPPNSIPSGQAVKVETIWRAYDHRWPIEPGFHFRKETLGWTMPMFQSKEAGDRWTEITALAAWIVYLARPLVEDMPLPWQKPQQRLTPQRVQQSIRPIFTQIASPARSPKPRGKAQGWPKGKHRTPKQRFPVVKKSPVVDKTA